jgi:hypothetical protein
LDPRSGALRFGPEHRLATSRREHLTVQQGHEYALAEQLGAELMRLYGRSLKLRVVSAGGCNGCEVDVNVLGTIGSRDRWRRRHACARPLRSVRKGPVPVFDKPRPCTSAGAGGVAGNTGGLCVGKIPRAFGRVGRPGLASL